MKLDPIVADELKHYGVKGMKWGVRKDRETKAQRQRSREERKTQKRETKAKKFEMKASELSKEINAINKQLDGLSRSSKWNPMVQVTKANRKVLKNQLIAERDRALKDAERSRDGKLTSTQRKVVAGAVVTTAVVGAVGLTIASDTGQLNEAKLRVEKILGNKDSVFNKNPKYGKAYNNPEDILQNVVKDINPNFKKAGGKMNCRRCSFTYELRRRGYDVEATTSSIGSGQSASGFLNAVSKDGKRFNRLTSMSAPVTQGKRVDALLPGDNRKINIKQELIRSSSNKFGRISEEDIATKITSQPPGARGEIVFNMKQFAHSLSYENVNGKPIMFDTQKGRMYDLSGKSSYMSFTAKWGNPRDVLISRLDNVDLDEEFLARWSTNRSR